MAKPETLESIEREAELAREAAAAAEEKARTAREAREHEREAEAAAERAEMERRARRVLAGHVATSRQLAKEVEGALVVLGAALSKTRRIQFESLALREACNGPADGALAEPAGTVALFPALRAALGEEGEALPWAVEAPALRLRIRSLPELTAAAGSDRIRL